MDFSLLLHINYWAVAACAVVMFVLGMLWFSVVFAKAWVHELSLHNVVIKEPSQEKLLTNMGISMLKNIMIALAMACLVHLAGSATFGSGFLLGLMVALGFSVTAIADVFLWEGRSLKLFLIDAGYQMTNVVVSAIILSLLR